MARMAGNTSVELRFFRQNHSDIIVHRPNDYCIGLEQAHGLTFLHSEIWAPWSKDIKSRYKSDLQDAFDRHGGPWHVLATAPHDDDFEKHKKFVEMIGFSLISPDVLLYDGRRVPFYIKTR